MTAEGSSSSVLGWVIPWITLVLVVLVQVSFWYPIKEVKEITVVGDETTTDCEVVSKKLNDESYAVINTNIDTQQERAQAPTETISGNVTTKKANNLVLCNDSNNEEGEASKPLDQPHLGVTTTVNRSIDTTTTSATTKEITNDITSNDNNNNINWRCVCETGFLPAGLLKTFGGAESMVRLGTGQCYHKQV